MEVTSLDVSADFLSRFGRHFVHELNNPISAITSSVYLIDEFIASSSSGAVVIEQVAPFVTSIREEAGKLQQLVQDFARYAALNRVLTSPMEMTEFLGARVEEMTRRGLPVVFSASTEPITIAADAGTLGTAFQMLVADAHDAGATNVRLELGRTDTCDVCLTDDRTEATEEFLQGFEAGHRRRGDSLGLRLALVKKIVELHEGHLEILPRERGSELVVKLPIRI